MGHYSNKRSNLTGKFYWEKIRLSGMYRFAILELLILLILDIFFDDGNKVLKINFDFFKAAPFNNLNIKRQIERSLIEILQNLKSNKFPNTSILIININTF